MYLYILDLGFGNLTKAIQLVRKKREKNHVVMWDPFQRFNPRKRSRCHGTSAVFLQTGEAVPIPNT